MSVWRGDRARVMVVAGLRGAASRVFLLGSALWRRATPLHALGAWGLTHRETVAGAALQRLYSGARRCWLPVGRAAGLIGDDAGSPPADAAPVAEVSASGAAPVDDLVEHAIKRLIMTLLAERGGFRPVTHFLIVPTLRLDAFCAMATNLASVVAQQETPDGVLIVVAEETESPVDVATIAGVRVVHLCQGWQNANEHQRQAMLYALICFFRPRVIHNVDSPTCWNLFLDVSRPLSHIGRLYGSAALSPGDDGDARRCLQATMLQGVIPRLAGLMVHEKHRFSELSSLLALDERDRQKMHLVGGSSSPGTNSADELAHLHRFLCQMPGYLHAR